MGWWAPGAAPLHHGVPTGAAILAAYEPAKKDLGMRFESPNRFNFLIFLPLWNSLAQTPVRWLKVPQPGFNNKIRYLALIFRNNSAREPN